ncbi:hypothetical protein NLJ89_g1615 [Agrocybe chaxingu]|uniref:Uncharacterized protein n=1 Tax=Agrocybe chaxingu TaxID=84603 RepID=A0A9W8TEX5_9AGAR|nr:hypothetical protein NLJ89_g1615 [Agrocybe chaxingu]
MASSSAATQPPEVNLDFFFRWNPEPVVRSIKHTTATGTREPKWFDLHLDESLQLRSVTVVDKLLPQLARICHQYTTENPEIPQQVPLSLFSSFYTSRIYQLSSANINAIRGPRSGGVRSGKQKAKQAPQNESPSHNEQTVLNEKSLEELYVKEAGMFCAQVASAFAFGPAGSDPNDPLFVWTQKAREIQTHAKADVFLNVQPSSASRSKMLPAHRDDIDRIERHKLYHPVISEFKSLTAGDLKVMESIGAFSGNFSWIRCKQGGYTCGLADHNRDGRYALTGRKTGRDAVATEDILRACGIVLSSNDWEESEASDQVQDRYSSNTASGSGPEFVVASSSGRSQCPPTEETAMTDNKKAIFILQQGWAEAVLNDATFIIFTSGNLEFIGIRHRATQTLFLSSLNEVATNKETPYGLLHTALILRGYEDARERALQFDDLEKMPEDKHPFLYRLSFPEMPGSRVKEGKS